MKTDHTKKRTKTTRRFLYFACLLVFVGLVVLHRQLLRGIGNGLVVDESPTGVDTVVIFGGDGRYSLAATMLEDRTTKRILLIESRPSRLTELGITQKQSEVALEKLIELGVPSEDISIAEGDFAGDWRGVRILKQWLRKHPRENVAVISDRLGSRWVRYTLDRILDESDRKRVHIVALRDRRYDESNWWLKRTGWKVAFNAYFDLGYAVVCGEDEKPPFLSADEFEEQVIRQWNTQQE